MAYAPNARTVDGPCYRCPSDALGNDFPVDHTGAKVEIVRTVDEAVEACYGGYRTSARKAGRNPQFPYVPLIMRPDGNVPDRMRSEQIMKHAYRSRAEAVAYADGVLMQRREVFRQKLSDRSYRLLRRQWGVSTEKDII